MLENLAGVARVVVFVFCVICVNCSLGSRAVCDVAWTPGNKVQA